MEEVEEMKPAVDGGEADCSNKAKTALLANQQPPRPLSYNYHRRADDAAPECGHLPKKEQEEVTWTWKRKSLQGVNANIIFSYNKKALEDIRSVLIKVGGKKLLQRFLDGCFGHLMNFVGGTSCTRALHELISHEINFPGAQEDELWFHISGTNIRFSPAEYALVTGLRFGSSSFDPLGSHVMPPNGIRKRFCSDRPITIRELWKQFDSQRVRGSAEDYLRVAHILAFHLMGLGYSQAKFVEQWVWVLVEDLDVWNKFPWGAYTYQALMHYVSILPRTKLHLGVYNFHGPVWALQIWAYEAIPHLGNLCASVTGQVTMPRCLKWLFCSKNKNMDFAHFFEQELVCRVTLEPTDEEKLQPYWVSMRTPQPLGVRYNIPMRGGKRRVHSVVSTSMRANVSSSSDGTSSDTTSSSLQELRRSNRRRHRPTSLLEASSADPFVSGTDGRVHSTPMPSACQKFTISSGLSIGGKNGRLQQVHDLFDQTNCLDRVSGRVVHHLIEPVADRVTEKLIEPVTDRLTERLIKPVADRMTRKLVEPVVERLTQQLTPQMKQWMDDLFCQVRNERRVYTDSAKAAEFAGENQKEEKSFHRGSSSKHFSRKKENGPSFGEEKKPGKEVLKNASRLDTGIAGWPKPFVNQKDGIRSQIDRSKPVKWELKQKARTSPPRRANISKKKKKKKKMKSRHSPSSSEETSDDEGSESSSDEERRRKGKKRYRKKRAKYSDSSSSESDRHRRRRHKRRRSSSSDPDARGSRHHHHRPHGHHHHHSVSLPD